MWYKQVNSLKLGTENEFLMVCDPAFLLISAFDHNFKSFSEVNFSGNNKSA